MKQVYFILFVISAFFVSCENDIKTIKSFSNDKEVPSVTVDRVEILYSDSSKLKLRVAAPDLSKFENFGNPYTEFSKGLIMYMYNDSMGVKTIIKARYVKYNEKEKLWYAKNDVQVDNIEKNEHLNTEELYWSEENEKIYSSKFTRIINADGVFYGENGFEANQDLSKWRLNSIKGTVKVKANENESQNP